MAGPRRAGASSTRRWPIPAASRPSFGKLRTIGGCATSAHPEPVEGAPTRFSADGRVLARQNTVGDPLKATELSRLKKQWRKEWEAERAAERHDPQATAEALNDRIERFHKSWLAKMSPRTRRLYDLFEQAKDIDRQRRARHQLLRMPKDWTGSLWAEGESHPLGGVADENYRAETLGTVAEEQAEHAHHAAKLTRRGKRKGKGGE